MKYNKIFGVSALAMGVALGFTSCGSDDAIVEAEQPATVEAVAPVTPAQIGTTFAAGIKAGKIGKTAKAKAKAVAVDLSGGFVADGLNDLQDMLNQLYDCLTGEATEITAVIKLFNIYGTYTFNGESWVIEDMSNKNELVLNYANGEQNISLQLTYNKRQTLTCDLLTTQYTLFEKTFTVKAAANVPVDVDVVETINGNEVLNAGVAIEIENPSDFNLSRDPFTVKGSIVIGEGTVENAATIKAGTVLSLETTVYNANGEELGSFMVTPIENGVAIDGTIPATQFTPEAKLSTSVVNVKEVTDAISLLYQTGDENLAGMYAYVVEQNVAPIVLSYNIDGEWTPVVEITFELGGDENGYYLQPVFTPAEGAEEVVDGLITEYIPEEILGIAKIIIEIIQALPQPTL